MDHVIEQQLRSLNLALERRVRERTASLEEAARELWASQLQYQSLVDSATDAVLAVDGDGRILEWNRGAENIFGYPKSEMIGSDVSLILQPARRDALPGWLGLCRDSTVGAGPRVVTGVRQDGTELALELCLGAWEVNGRYNFSCILRDISERLETDARANRQRVHFETIFNSNPEAVVFSDVNRRIQMCNPACGRLFGYPCDEIAGQSARLLYPGEDSFEAVGTNIRAGFKRAGSGPISLEVRFQRRGGDDFPAELVVSRVVDGAGEITGYLGIIRDLTARRLLEEQFRQAQKMEAVGQLAGGVAHDFNNLLTVITGYTSMLETDMEMQDPRREMLSEIGNAAEKAAALTSQLLTFSRRHVVKTEVFDLNRVVDGCRKMLQRLIGEDIDFRVDQSSEPVCISADRGQLEQLLMNLAVNARDAMPEGGLLHLRTAGVILDTPTRATPEILAPGRYVEITVADTGIGMDADTQARLFEPFFTTKPVGKGTGLGLATVYGIVAQAQGGLVVKSAPRKGTTFRVYLPQVEAVLPPPPQTSAPLPLPSGGETILVVEDETLVRRFITRALEGQGYAVLQAADGQAGLDVMLRDRPAIDLLVTDIVMPRMSGATLAEYVRTAHPESRILFLSGYMDDKVARYDLRRDDVNFLRKPLNLATFLQMVRDILDRPAPCGVAV